jgi:transposase
MKATKRGNSRWSWVLRPSCPRCVHELNRGDTVKPGIIEPWRYSKAWYKRRNEIERLFRRLKGFRRIFSRFDKLDVMFMAFLCFALVVEALR